MAVFKKKRENGSYSKNWYYEFVIGNIRYRGSTYKSSKSEAIEYEQNIKSDLRALSKKEDCSKVKKDNLIRFRDKITSEVQGAGINLEDIWQTFRQEAPSKMRRIPSEKGWAEKEAYLKDFLYFLKEKHPQCRNMRDITSKIAEQYIGLIKTSGRFCKTIEYKGRTYESKITKLSSSSVNEYITQLKQVFRILSDSAGLLENPFAQIEKAPKKSKKRDVFEIHELEKIDSYLEGFKQAPPFLSKDKLNFLINEAVFTIGVNTGMRRGDISLLKWSDVNFKTKVIKRELLKTEEEVFIPMTRRLYDFLKQKQKNAVNEYVTPELAEMYLSNSEGISYRFKKMLQELNIKSLKLHEGRSRQTSNKDIHSLRHTFCYLHGMQGTRLIVLQSMVGHMDKKMTESYMMHQTEQLKREAIEKFSLQPFQPISLNPANDKKAKISDLLRNCDSEKMLEDILAKLQDNERSQDRGGPEGGTRHGISW